MQSPCSESDLRGSAGAMQVPSTLTHLSATTSQPGFHLIQPQLQRPLRILAPGIVVSLHCNAIWLLTSS